MLNSVNDVLTPWTPLRILRIMEAASASRGAGGKGGSGLSTTADDGAMAMESLLRLSNQQPDVAGRVMAAPLFAQRPLIDAGESASASPASQLLYPDAHQMCTHTLQLCRPARKETERDGVAHTLESSGPPLSSSSSAPGSTSAADRPPYTAATEMEEVAFAAEFAEPCLRGTFPDVASVVEHILPANFPLLLPKFHPPSSKDRSEVRNAKAVQGVVQSLLQEPAVSHKKPPEDDAEQATTPAPSLRLHLGGPTPATAATARPLLSSLPSAAAVPLRAWGPPGHKVFDTSAVAHTFTTAEACDLQAYFANRPRPFRVYSSAEVRARRLQASQSQRRNAMPTAGPGAARIVGPDRAANATASAQATGRHVGKRASRGADDEHDGWSASSGWSSSRSNSNSDHSARESGSDAEDDAESRPRTPLLPTAGEEASTATPPAAETTASQTGDDTAPQRPAPTRTWIGDDGDLVLENGKVTIRKRRLRVLKNAPPPLPLPKMVGGPVAKALEPAVVAPALDGDAVTGSDAAVAIVSVDDNVTQDTAVSTEVVSTAPAKEARLKRGRANAEAVEEVEPPTAGSSRKRAKQANAKRGANKKSAPGEAKASAAAVIDTATAPRLSEAEMVEFVGRLPVSDFLRRALLLGVQPAPDSRDDAQGEVEEHSSARKR